MLAPGTSFPGGRLQRRARSTDDAQDRVSGEGDMVQPTDVVQPTDLASRRSSGPRPAPSRGAVRLGARQPRPAVVVRTFGAVQVNLYPEPAGAGPFGFLIAPRAAAGPGLRLVSPTTGRPRRPASNATGFARCSGRRCRASSRPPTRDPSRARTRGQIHGTSTCSWGLPGSPSGAVLRVGHVERPEPGRAAPVVATPPEPTSAPVVRHVSTDAGTSVPRRRQAGHGMVG